MKHDEFIGQVQARARLDSRGEAEKTTRVLEALGERLAGGQLGNLAGQPPEEIGRHLLGSNELERISLESGSEARTERQPATRR